MTDPYSILGKSEHEYLGWKIRITNTTVESKFSARIEVWKPEHDPRSHNGIAVGFPKTRCIFGGGSGRGSSEGKAVD
jgi:hypothetical protein